MRGNRGSEGGWPARSRGVLLGLAVAVPLLLGFVASGCTPIGSRGTGSDPFDRDGEARGGVVLRVENLLQEQVTIRVASGGSPRELGEVPGRSSRQFSLALTGSRISLQLEPFSGRRHTMPQVAVQAGDVLDLRVVNPIERSVLTR